MASRKAVGLAEARGLLSVAWMDSKMPFEWDSGMVLNLGIGKDVRKEAHSGKC